MASETTVKIEMIQGVEGPSLYLNGTRIAGNKPWGGGRIVHTWRARICDIEEVINSLKEGKDGR